MYRATYTYHHWLLIMCFGVQVSDRHQEIHDVSTIWQILFTSQLPSHIGAVTIAATGTGLALIEVNGQSPALWILNTHVKHRFHCTSVLYSHILPVCNIGKIRECFRLSINVRTRYSSISFLILYKHTRILHCVWHYKSFTYLYRQYM